MTNRILVAAVFLVGCAVGGVSSGDREEQGSSDGLSAAVSELWDCCRHEAVAPPKGSQEADLET